MRAHDKALWIELVKLQNSMTHIDIMTITQFMSQLQLEQHVALYRNKLESAL